MPAYKWKRLIEHLRNERFCVGVITDRIVAPRSFDKMSDKELRHLTQVARKHGISDPGGADYYPQLARFPGDPEAFCRNRTEIRRVLERRGWKSEGMVERD